MRRGRPPARECTFVSRRETWKVGNGGASLEKLVAQTTGGGGAVGVVGVVTVGLSPSTCYTKISPTKPTIFYVKNGCSSTGVNGARPVQVAAKGRVGRYRPISTAS